ncbi:BA14K family protein [Aquamicrobium sp. LC103]|uniref:BA14K family protein n=1 Tax=Aquamicrobium sp. LC103 TaxID=1120658 RepID=UPI00063EA2B9|nr:BA14K family protein [Aquamicrobium sp. LC103]TKT79315.1 BA14K family protein [Aquamicrobium sp. LC103]
MMKIVSSLCAAAMALSIPFAAPAVAMPAPKPVFDQVNTTNVQYRDRRHYRDRRDHRRGGYYRQGNRHYYNGHRGYRHHRPGYRRHNGYWFPPAAFIAGAIIGGAIASQPPVRYRPRGNAHVDWCYARYRSYRASDNTFQPYNGPRRQCISPY